MKTLLGSLTAALFSFSAFATSPIHPYTASVNEIDAVLKDKAVQEKLFKFAQPVTNVAREKLRSGLMGWVVTTEKCALEVAVTYKPVGKMNPAIPGGHATKREVTVGDCR